MSANLPVDGFLLEAWTADANSTGGRRRRHMYVISSEPIDEPDGWLLVGQGAHVLAKARELGIADGGHKIVDA